MITQRREPRPQDSSALQGESGTSSRQGPAFQTAPPRPGGWAKTRRLSPSPFLGSISPSATSAAYSPPPSIAPLLPSCAPWGTDPPWDSPTSLSPGPGIARHQSSLLCPVVGRRGGRCESDWQTRTPILSSSTRL